MASVILNDRFGHKSEPETIVRERQLSWLLMAFIIAGLAFMLLPGTFLGVWNLFAISSRRSGVVAEGQSRVRLLDPQEVAGD